MSPEPSQSSGGGTGLASWLHESEPARRGWELVGQGKNTGLELVGQGKNKAVQLLPTSLSTSDHFVATFVSAFTMFCTSIALR